MEDMHYIRISPTMVLVGIMDGHAGDSAAIFSARHYPTWLEKRIKSDWTSNEEIQKLTVAFDVEMERRTDEEYKSDEIEEITGKDEFSDESDRFHLSGMEHSYQKPGCTSVSVALVKRPESGTLELIGINLGDSRAVFGDIAGNDVVLSNDHRPDVPKELERIEKAGMNVSYGYIRSGRYGDLGVARAFGDYGFKWNKELPREEQAVTAVPEIIRHSIAKPTEEPKYPQQEFVFLGCDGIFERWKTEDVMAFIRSRLSAQRRGEYVKLRRGLLGGILRSDDSTGGSKEIDEIVEKMMKQALEFAKKHPVKEGEKFPLEGYDVASIVNDVLYNALRRGSGDNVTAMIVLVDSEKAMAEKTKE